MYSPVPRSGRKNHSSRFLRYENLLDRLMILVLNSVDHSSVCMCFKLTMAIIAMTENVKMILFVVFLSGEEK